MPRGRPRGTFAISDWEMDELLWYHSRGWTADTLASYYGISSKTVERYLRRARGGAAGRVSSPAARTMD